MLTNEQEQPHNNINIIILYQSDLLELMIWRQLDKKVDRIKILNVDNIGVMLLPNITKVIGSVRRLDCEITNSKQYNNKINYCFSFYSFIWAYNDVYLHKT